jgi:chromosome segregation ATPase
MIPLLLGSGAAGAADDEAARLREQLRSTVLQLRELQDQPAAAAAKPAAPAPDSDSAGLKAKLSAAEAQLRAARRQAGDVAALKGSLDKSKADFDALSATVAASQAELEKYKAAFSQASDVARATGAERDRLQAELASQTTIAMACQAKNTRLVAFAEGLIDASNRITFGRKVMAREPLLGFTRVRLENLAQDREDTVRGAVCDPRLDARPPAKAATPAPTG